MAGMVFLPASFLLKLIRFGDNSLHNRIKFFILKKVNKQRIVT